MNDRADESITARRRSIDNHLAYLMQCELLYFFFDVKGVITTASAADM